MSFNRIKTLLTSVKNVTDQEVANLSKYVELLLQYNQNINLISRFTEENVWERHILDSAQILPLIREKNDIILDIGSGAGLPGIVLSILGIKHMILVESRTKKVRFLEKASEISPNHIEILHKRVEELEPRQYDIVTARAVAPLNDLLYLTYKFINPTKKSIFFKGKSSQTEIDFAKQKWNFNYRLSKSITDPQASIVELYNLSLKSKCKKML